MRGHFIVSLFPATFLLPTQGNLSFRFLPADFNSWRFWYKVKISDVRTSKISPASKKITGLLFPAQESETKENQQAKPVFKIDKSAYATRGIISSDTVKIEPLGTVRNNKLANLYVSPVRYNPLSNSLEIITSMRIEIIFSDLPMLLPNLLLPKPGSMDETLNKGILNYNPGQVIPGFSSKPVKMVIVTDVAFKKQFSRFLNGKPKRF